MKNQKKTMENPVYKVSEHGKSTKENTLYLPIKQIYFDQIVAGTKKEEFRDIKDTTFKKYLNCEGERIAYSLDLTDNPKITFYDYNNGVFPMFPRLYSYLNLAVGYNKERDSALVEIDAISFMVAKDPDGEEIRYFIDDKDGMITESAEGDQTFWLIVYHLGKVVSVERKKKTK